MPNVQESALYGGKVKIRFFPDSHQYWVNGVRKTGVTTFIGIVDKSKPLVIWATELARDFLLEKLTAGEISESHVYEACELHDVRKKEAADIGSIVHEWVEKYIGGEVPDMPEQKEAQIGVNAFLDWVKEHDVKFISSERVVYSKKYDFIGKMDIEAKVKGKLCLIDLKTSNGLYNTYGMQTAAYLRADEEESGKSYKGRWLIRLAKETEKEYWDRMEKKNKNREWKGKERIQYEPYQVFEAKYLDDQPGNIDRDYKAFLNAKELFMWNSATDFFKNKDK